MRDINIKKLIAVIFTTCALLGCASVAYAEKTTKEEIEPKLELYIPSVSTSDKQPDTHVENTPMWDDELGAVVTYDKEKIKEEPVITWYRFNNHPLYDDKGVKIQDTYYEVINQGPIYRVMPEDIHHILKIEAKIAGRTLVVETKPVEKRNYGDIRLKVVDNTNYGDTDGYVGLLDTRMQYTCDEVNVFDVTYDGAVLNSGATLDTLNPNGFTWKVRYADTTLVEGSKWFTFTIQAGHKNPLEDIDINLISRTLTPDEPDYQLKTLLTPENAYVNAIIYKSSDEKVATVSEDGIISAVNNGEATISVTVKGVDKEFTKECAIEVEKFDEVYEAIIEEDNISLELRTNDKIQLTSKIYPATAEDYKESWRSSDEKICTVSEKGIVSGVNPGNAMVIYTVSQGDKQVIDTVNVEVIPNPAVTSPETWKQGSWEDVKFDFVGCKPDENTIVTVKTADGRHELVTNNYYYIKDCSIVLSYNYMMTVPEGNASFDFSFTEDVDESQEEFAQNNEITEEQNSNYVVEDNTLINNDGTTESEIKEVPVPKFTSTSSKNSNSRKFSLLKTTSNTIKNIFTKVDSTTSGSNNKFTVYANPIKVVSSSTVQLVLEPGKTFMPYKYDVPADHNGGYLTDKESFIFEYSEDFNKYFNVSDVVIDSEVKTLGDTSVEKVKGISFVIESLGINISDAQIVELKIKTQDSSAQPQSVGKWEVKGNNFVNYSISLTNYAEIYSDSQSKCIISPTIKDENNKEVSIDLNKYSIVFKEVDGIDSDSFNGWAHYFVDKSLVLTKDNNVEVVANREGTGYIKAYLRLRNLSPGYEERDYISQTNSNACVIKNILYTDVTKSNINHQWAQNSTVNLTYTVQGDFRKFYTDNGEFTDNNVYLWYKKGNTVNRLKMSLNHFKIERVNDNLATVTINYNFLRRLHLGSYPLYIVFKYDGSNIYRDRWSERGNYILTTFTIVKAGTPITGDEFNPGMWAFVAALTIPATFALAYILKKKKMVVVTDMSNVKNRGTHESGRGSHEIRRGSHQAK